MSARVYRDDLRCPHYDSNRTSKDGHSHDKQTYRCGQCRYRFTSDGNRHYYPEAIKIQAVTMYVEGMYVLAIGRTLGVKPGTIYSWLKKSIRAWTALRVSRRKWRQRRVRPGAGDCL